MPNPNLRLKYERQQRGWSQNYLAEQIDVPDYYISRWERGEVLPSPLYQQKLCELFKKTAQELGFLQFSPDTPLPGTLRLDHPPTTQGAAPTRTETLVEQMPFPQSQESPSMLSSASSPIAPAPHDTKPAPLPSVPISARRPPRSLQRPVLILILGLVALIVLFAVARVLVLASAHPAPAPSVIGQVDFLSSGQLNDMTNQGIADQVHVELHPLANPTSGNSYYAWLLPDANLPENPPLLLGKLRLENGIGQLSYQDPQYTNLLTSMSRFLITEENGTNVPLTPSTDTSTWRYQAQIPNIHPAATPGEASYSFLDHIRHLLVADPTVRAHGLSGGLVKWLVLNTDTVAEWASAARDEWRPGGTFPTQLLRRYLTQILDYVDGTTFVPLDTSGIPLPENLVDPQIGSLGLLQFTSQQQPPGYLDHIEFHLHGLVSAPLATPMQQKQVGQIESSINRMNTWLQQVREDAKRLLMMNDTQLREPAGLTLLNNLHLMATAASTGTTDPMTGAVQEGAAQVAQEIQRLAIVDMMPYP